MPSETTSGFDWVEELGRVLEEAGLSLTFSANCRSGIVGRERCRCWRCLGIDPEAEDPAWQETAQLLSLAFDNGARLVMREQDRATPESPPPS